ncbi:MAG: glycosyltransferase [Lachnospiraceae bacterium]|nr:glycosyltransferase [Lachnospiraceae bacterium]
MEQDIMYSVIVVCLNAGHRLYETIDSILEQNYKNFEIIIKDGGSLDDSVKRLALQYQDERIHVHTKKDNGIYDAMNQAVKLAKGEYFLFLNTGDSFYNEHVLEKITYEIDEFRKKNIKTDIIYGNMYHKALDTVIYASPEINDFTCYRNVPCHQTCFYHRTMFDIRGYRPAYNVRADYEHFLWCYYEQKAVISYVPVVIASYEGGGYSETKENKKWSKRQHREIVVHYMGKKKANRYKMVMLLTLAPLRSAIADSKYLSVVYNGVKTTIYKLKDKAKG